MNTTTNPIRPADATLGAPHSTVEILDDIAAKHPNKAKVARALRDDLIQAWATLDACAASDPGAQDDARADLNDSMAAAGIFIDRHLRWMARQLAKHGDAAGGAAILDHLRQVAAEAEPDADGDRRATLTIDEQTFDTVAAAAAAQGIPVTHRVA
ncbi:hypothetical protein [uncultured Rhodospira sp.]|uniref:hypothetical protein n=1 Tax=uncultured Rhodospira sp. TaxID=1936189 RepID=UPI002627F10E|nr:hypothetical protein [uncultured Rhodospira sp.]